MNLDEYHHVSESIFASASDTVFFIFHVPCTALFTVYFHAVTSVFSTSIYTALVIDRTRKQTLLTKWFNFVFTKDLPSISQSNVQAVKAEKEEQYTFSKMIYIKLTNCCFFFHEVYFQAPKMYTNQLSSICNGVHFFCFFVYQKYASLLFKIFAQICSIVICKGIFEILRTSVSEKTF